ncbi:MAG: hypothetical protein ACJAWV_000222 [Flammeovirgaceae bacterium]|jgi:hypothetical protein
MTLQERLALMQEADELIRNKATGCREQFAKQLGIKIPTLYRLINEMKECFGAPIVYSNKQYQYTENGKVKFGFVKLKDGESNQLRGGIRKMNFSHFLRKHSA